MPPDELWTVGRLLKWTTDYLQKQGSESARLDAELLLAEARQCPRIALYTSFDEEVDEQTRTAFRQLVRQRAEGMPVAYLLGRREFYSLDFLVNSDVLIPRPETELVVVELLDRAKEYALQGETLRVADVGTGSGILAVCAALHLKGAPVEVTALDLSEPALQVAKQNAAAHQVDRQITFLQSDLLSVLPQDAKFDFILSNPPYVKEEELESLAVDVRQYEPELALVAGPRGTEIYERLVPQAAEHLLPGGWLIVEIHALLEKEISQLLEADPRFGAPQVTKDLARLPRVIAAQRTASEG